MTNRQEIERLVDIELAEANERYPLFHSPHEAYAVLLEEVQEMQDEADAIDTTMHLAWNEIKLNINISESIGYTYNHALYIVQEAIQVAAMCKKVEMSNLYGDKE